MRDIAKEFIKENGPILIISSDDELYNEAKKYGFKRVNKFNSVLEANMYFKENKERIGQYTSIFLYNLSNADKTFLNEKSFINQVDRSFTFIGNIKKEDSRLYFSDYSTTNNKLNRYDCSIKDGCLSKFSDFFDFLFRGPYELNTVDSMLRQGFYSKYKVPKLDNNKVMPVYPKKVSDIKVLFVSPEENKENNKLLQEDLQKKLGVKIKVEHESAIDINKLGQFDIIIGDLTNLGVTHENLCPMLINNNNAFIIYAPYISIIQRNNKFKSQFLDNEYTLPNKIFDVGFSFGIISNLMDEIHIGEDFKSYLLTSNDDEISWYKYFPLLLLKYKDVLNSFYPNTLNKNEFSYLKELYENGENAVLENCKYKDNVNIEEKKVYDLKIEERKNKEKVLNKELDRLNNAYKILRKYIENENRIDDSTLNISIEKCEDGIEVIRYYNDIPLCKITFCDSIYNNVKKFKVQTKNKKGNLNGPVDASYFFDFDKLAIKKPEEELDQIIKSTISIIEKNVYPLISDYIAKKHNNSYVKRKKRKH
ncbi:MAG: hypothetical protein IJ094_04005 [Bacilli bacterium]|nr:hypothetical protein [Bacilli bacterium]